MKYEGKSVPGKEKSRCKGPEAGTKLMRLRKSKKAGVSGASGGRKKGLEVEQAGWHQLTWGLSGRKMFQV